MSEQRSIELRLKANIGDFKQQLNSAADAASGMGKAIEDSSRKVEQARDRQRDAAQQLAAAEKRLASVQASGASASKVAMAQKEVTRAKNLNTAATKQLTAAEAAHAKVATRASTTLGQLAQSAANNRDVWTGMATGLTRTGLALGAVVAVAGYKMAQFDSAMSKVAATGDDARANLGALRAEAIKVGADTIFTAKEAAEGITNLLKAGVSAKDVLGGGLVGTMNLAAAGELAVADAAEIAATALTVFGLKGSDMSHVADLLAAGAGKAQGEVSDLAVALKYVGPVAAGMGVSIEETVGALSSFASQGLLADQAGTSLRGVLMSMTSPSKAASKEMERLGITLYDGQGKFLGLTNVAGQLEKAYAGVSDQAKDTSLGIIFGNAQVTAARVLFSQGAAGIQEWTAKVNDAGYAARAAAIMMDNLGGDVEKLGGAVDSALIKSGSGLNSFARDLVQSLTSAVDALGNVPGPVLEAGTRLTAFAAIAALTGGGLIKLGTGAFEAWTSFRTLQKDSPKVAAGLGRVAKAAGIAAAAIAVIEIGRIFGSMHQAEIDKTKASLADVAEALARIASEGQAAQGLDQLNEQFRRVDTMADSVGDSILLMGATSRDGFANGLAGLNEWAAGLIGLDGGLKPVREQVEKVDQQLSQMDGKQAAAAFRAISADAQRVGASVEMVTEAFPEYKARLQETATAMGVTGLTAQDYAEWMGGKVPAAVQAATAAHPDLVGKLNETQQSALDGAQSLEQYAASLYEAANAAIASSGSQVGFERSIDNTRTAVQKLLAETKKAGKTKNLTNIDTEEGRKGVEILNNLATATNSYSANLIKSGASQEEVRLTVARGRADFIASAKAMGYSAKEAKALADSRGLIPKNVTLETTDKGTDVAKTRTDALKDAIKGLPKKTQTEVLSAFEKGGVDEAYTALRKIDGKKADAFIRSLLQRQGIIDWQNFQPAPKTAIINTRVVARSSTTVARASGGSVRGPGTETSDSIPALLSNNEHVWSAREVRGAGGHAAMERLRAMARRGQMPAFADGGAVVRLASGGSATAKAREAAKKAAEAARDRAEARRLLERELRVDVRRGTIREDVLSGSGMSVIDDLIGWSRDSNLSKTARARLRKQSARFESALGKLSGKLESAQSKVDELQQVFDSVKSGLNSFDLSSALEPTRTQTFDSKTGKATWTEKNATASDIAAAANSRAHKVKVFAQKLAQLQKNGASPAVMAEIAALGADAGIPVVDEFLKDTAALASLNQSYKTIDKYSSAAAQSVTEASYEGGLAAAEAMVKKLTKEMGALGSQMADAFAAALGLKVSGKSLKKRATGGHVVAGELYQVNERGTEMFRPAMNGYILNAQQTAAAGRVTHVYLDGIVKQLPTQLVRNLEQVVDFFEDAPGYAGSR